MKIVQYVHPKYINPTYNSTYIQNQCLNMLAKLTFLKFTQNIHKSVILIMQRIKSINCHIETL